ncbi:MAG: carbon starvation protein A [Phycisphaerales bacterium JB058]
METVLVALGSMVLYVVAYRTYGRYLGQRVFRVDPDRVPPSVEREDGVDFVPSKRSLVFGHHFTSIAGTGPIVGPAVAVVWGWVPALLWVTFGSIFIGAVHDFGSLIVSMRHRGRTIADLAGDVVNPRVRLLFLLIVLVALWIVLAIFGLVIATVFASFPSSVAPVWLQIPIAVGLGVWVRRGGSVMIGMAVSAVLMYATIAWSSGVDWANVWGEGVPLLPAGLTNVISPVAFWTLLLMAYVFVASVLPVQTLLQPRDFINAVQLLIAMALVLVGLLVSRPAIVADAVNFSPAPAAEGAVVPGFLPFLFVTIACGACSGFHCLVASGCSSRQLSSERDAQAIGYGSMLTEGFLATLVILACAAGIGMSAGKGVNPATGVETWHQYYATWGGDKGLGAKLTPFIEGSANMIESIGLSHGFAVAIMGVFVASFAATTLDSSTRLQRYIIAELAGGGKETGAKALRIPVLTNRFVGSGVAVATALALALGDALTKQADGTLVGLAGAGKGGLILWPIFGATNQLLAGLALLVVTIWLVRQKRSAWVTAVPMVFMLVMTGWASVELMRGFVQQDGKLLLTCVMAMMFVFEVWIVIEAAALVVRQRSERGLPAGV